MELKQAASVFATLGHPDRLAILRLLMRFAPRGQRPTEIAQILGMKQNTLSHHLGDLTAVGLLGVTRQGRSLFYAVNLDMTETLIGYLALDVARARADVLSPILKQNTFANSATALNVLFLCSGNSARSIMAEALLRDLGKGRFRAFSAGTDPGPAPHPQALKMLTDAGHAVADLRSKHLSEFQRPHGPQMDIVITVCDRAAAQDCPPWSGHPVSTHWGLPDPVHAPPPQMADPSQSFQDIYAALRLRLEALVDLPVGINDRHTIQTSIDGIDKNALFHESD